MITKHGSVRSVSKVAMINIAWFHYDWTYCDYDRRQPKADSLQSARANFAEKQATLDIGNRYDEAGAISRE